jgi:Metallo-beta-lactamase superfamily
MKQLHRKDLWCWSVFDEDRNIDFHSFLWVREGGNIVIDPLPMTAHDRGHLDSLGGVATIIVTNSDHVRATSELTSEGVRVLGPSGEADGPIFCDRGSEGACACDGFLADGDEPIPGLKVHTLEGSKTKGELALVLDGTTLICGDLVRAHEGGRLCLLPDPKLSDKDAAVSSVGKLAAIATIDAVITSDGWPVFRDGHAILLELMGELGR